MNIREFAKLIAGSLKPAERAQLVRQAIKNLLMPSGKPRRIWERFAHDRASSRYAARRRQKDSRAEQRAKGTYRRPQ